MLMMITLHNTTQCRCVVITGYIGWGEKDSFVALAEKMSFPIGEEPTTSLSPLSRVHTQVCVTIRSAVKRKLQPGLADTRVAIKQHVLDNLCVCVSV